MGTVSQTLDGAIARFIKGKPKDERYAWMNVCHEALEVVPDKRVDVGIGYKLRIGDVLYQEHWSHKMSDLAAGYLLGQFWHGLTTGTLEVTFIEAGGVPLGDSEREENQRMLDNLPGPFRADVYQDQNNADSDGQILWTGPLHGHFTWGEEDRGESVAPLEIGSCSLATIYSHIVYEGCVCRWPYNLPTLFLINRRDLEDPFFSNCAPEPGVRSRKRGKSKRSDALEAVARPPQLSLDL